ncbi:MAG: fructosamine kinase family protein [Armatimonadetes bacterium]|nr:fructosamine kinase family protein [Armatimonadota bacterium]
MTEPVDIGLAEAVLKHCLGDGTHCLSVKPMHGGMINRVAEVEIDRAPRRAVIKLSREEDPFRREADHLTYLRQETGLPVPEVYGLSASGRVVEESFIVLERLPGVHCGLAQMSQDDRRRIDRQLAALLVELHAHTRETYGHLHNPESFVGWLDFFGPGLWGNFEDARPRLPLRSLTLIPEVLDEMPRVFRNSNPPSLVHGDIWATNVMVEKRQDGWAVSGLIDPAARWADMEYELAYLEVFSTVGGAFFQHYCRTRPLKSGYELRRLYYWLNTLLLHVWLFGDETYVVRAVRTAEEIARQL